MFGCFLSMGLLVGCSIQTKTPEGAAVDLTNDEFSRYIEQVFRHHNAVVNELIFVAKHQKDDDGVSALEEAELEMNEACYSLNELVSMEVTGRRPGIQIQMQLSDTVPDCEMATRKVEALLSSDL